MNARTAPIARTLAALWLIAMPLAGCGSHPDMKDAPLAGAAIGGPFALVDQNGRRVTDRSYAGRFRAIYFGYSYCPDVCPTTLQALMQGYHAFAKDHAGAAAKLVPIFISVDPGRDTPAVLKTYVAAFGPELQGLTGTPQEIAAAAKAYAVSYSRQATAPGASGYLVNHSSVAILFDPDGKPITTLPTDQGGNAVADTLAQWVR